MNNKLKKIFFQEHLVFFVVVFFFNWTMQFITRRTLTLLTILTIITLHLQCTCSFALRILTLLIATLVPTHILHYYSTNCNTIQIWSWCFRYLSSVGNRYPAIYVASYVGRKSKVKKCRQKDFKMLRAVLLSICWIIKQLSCSISRNIVWF